MNQTVNTPSTSGRWIALSAALVLAASGMILGFSITTALFDLGGFLSGPGYFFTGYYGILAFLIPAYLVYAAILLADPRYKPGRIFVLTLLVIPFVTISLGVFWIRNFEVLSQTSPFFSSAGRIGMFFMTLAATAIEAVLITFLYSLLFGAKGYLVRKETFGKAKTGSVPLLTWFRHSPRTRLNDIYTEAAAGSVEENPPPVDEEALIPIEEKEEPSVGDLVQAAPAADENFFPDVEEALAKASAEAEKAAAVKHAVHSSDSDHPETHRKGKKKNKPYSVPVEGLLNQYPDGEYWIIDDATRNAAHVLKETLKEFKIQAEVTGIKKGPVITMFEILPAPGVKLSKIVNLQDNIALRLAASSVRIVAPIPGKHAVGIEVPNAKRNIVSFREIIEDELDREGKKPEIPVILGKDITGDAITVDLAAMPHLLIAGATGSGKSVCVNAMILSILYQKSPVDCRLILIDPKIVELKLYNGIGHLLTPVITEPKRAFQALQYCIYEMERRYACLDSMGVRDIRSYNKRLKERDVTGEHMPYIVVIIDEFADLMATTGKELESTVARLAAMSRAVGIHLVLATQRPSIDIITGLIKANIPSRIAFMVAGRMNSQIIIDSPGAEKLLGRGDMLYAGVVDPFPIRMQGAFVSEEEVERVVDYVKGLGEPNYIDEEIFYDEEEEEAEPSLFSDGGDPLYEKALEIVMLQGKASASYIQRRLKIGYNRSARLVEEMEYRGVVGPAQGSRPREILRRGA